MATLTPELDGKMRQYKRILLSYADFKHAKLASSYILDQQLHENYPEESYVILEAMNCSMIIAYCRPFSGNTSRAAGGVPDLPGRLLRVLNSEERAIHKVVMQDRNKVLAHSDDEAIQVEPVILQVAGRDMVLPVKSWGLAPLTKEATIIFRSAAKKLFVATMEERQRLEPELIPYLRVANPENPFEPADRWPNKANSGDAKSYEAD
ncbi:hypothetical protein [Sedimenticola selenatireducens]|uniref:hypothetical protein n=1 Tax=Sedimenticola selenatireducens TaxID=191960 RepID=UPI002AABE192|nr:hypothetical protein [Sedimenticola selenatireducens]